MITDNQVTEEKKMEPENKHLNLTECAFSKSVCLSCFSNLIMHQESEGCQ